MVPRVRDPYGDGDGWPTDAAAGLDLEHLFKKIKGGFSGEAPYNVEKGELDNFFYAASKAIYRDVGAPRIINDLMRRTAGAAGEDSFSHPTSRTGGATQRLHTVNRPRVADGPTEASGCGTSLPATTTTATPLAMPTELTLKVDGTTVTDTLATGKYTDSGGVVVNTYYTVPSPMKAGETLTATATANAPLPPGWSITIFTYSGTICKTETTTCGPAKATFPGGANAGMGITAQLNTTTGYYSASINAAAVLPTTTTG